MKNENVLQFKVTVDHPFGVKVGKTHRDLLESTSFSTDLRLLGLYVCEQAASGGVLKDEDVGRCWKELLIGFITLKGNILAISESFDHISMMEALNH